MSHLSLTTSLIGTPQLSFSVVPFPPPPTIKMHKVFRFKHNPETQDRVKKDQKKEPGIKWFQTATRWTDRTVALCGLGFTSLFMCRLQKHRWLLYTRTLHIPYKLFHITLSLPKQKAPHIPSQMKSASANHSAFPVVEVLYNLNITSRLNTYSAEPPNEMRSMIDKVAVGL